jgi:hypothetical protein
VTGATAFVVVALLLAVAAHVVTRVVDAGQRPAVVRAYALAGASVDAIVALAFSVAVALAVLIVQAAVQAPFDSSLDGRRLGPGWGGLVISHGVIAALAFYLGVRAAIRFLRALLGGNVGYPVHHPVY